jgi:hypothetical protein
VERYVETGFVPTQQDVLKCRLRKRGVDDAIVNGDNPIRVIDASGERNKWRKWIHQFDFVKTVVFVVSLSADDYRIRANSKENWKFLGKTVKMFEELASVFRSSHMIVVLNKMDLFELQLEQTPLSHHFPDFKGGSNSPYDEYEFISSMFLAKETEHDVARVFSTLWTNATDENNGSHCVSDIIEISIRCCRGFSCATYPI